MAAAAGRPDDGTVARLLVVWTRPHHLSEAEAEAWASAEVARLASSDGIAAARLSRLRGASARSSKPWDWLLELEVAPAAVGGCVESRALREWLADLRLLGMDPAAMVVDSGRELRGGGA
jgi:hypothetical protein